MRMYAMHVPATRGRFPNISNPLENSGLNQSKEGRRAPGQLRTGVSIMVEVRESLTLNLQQERHEGAT